MTKWTLLVMALATLVWAEPNVVTAESRTWAGATAADAEIELAIQQGKIPGAVLLVGQGGKVRYKKAYGKRALVPAEEEMTLDTIFDVASLTKIVSTTSSCMRLYEQGKLDIEAPVNRYIPEFQGGKSPVTVRQLLTHYSGLRPDLDIAPAWYGYDTGLKLAYVEKLQQAPDTKFVYSDINFILLGEIVQRLSGKPLQDFAREEVFLPLGMTETGYLPHPKWMARIAPTEVLPGTHAPIRGTVHDDTTRYMGGVAGHAGVFSTAEDLSHWAQMLLQEGMWNGKRIFKAETVRLFTSPQTPKGMADVRGLGFDTDSRFSSNRGELYPAGKSFGHTGFTGTSIWVDPGSQSYVILLANSVHPYRRTAIVQLRRRVATIAAASFGVQAAKKAKVATGLDVLKRDKFKSLQGKKVGLITNHTGLDSEGNRNVDVMLAAGVKVTALFGPEHGIAGKADHENIGDELDPKTKIPVYSLYRGSERAPNDEQLKKVDVLVFDIQDIGARFYTYMCTMQNTMKEAARLKKPFIVLDRPNPIGGLQVDGPMLDPDLKSFVGCTEIPVQHGMTLGELANWMNLKDRIGAELQVVRMDGWTREQWFDETGLAWVNPSPNMRNLNAAAIYTGVALIEGSKNLSVGRGTDWPLEVVGAPWVDGAKLAAYLNARGIQGAQFEPVVFTPRERELKGQRCQGVRILVTERRKVSGNRVGLEVASALIKLFPGNLAMEPNRFLIGNRQVMQDLASGRDAAVIAREVQGRLDGFLVERKGFLLY